MTQYLLEGYGDNSKRALSDLTKKESELINKLKKAGESIDLNHNTTYYAHYTGKLKFIVELICTEFTIKHSFLDKIEAEAKKRANGGELSSYDTKFTIKRNYDLSTKQFNAATRRDTSSTPAGIDIDDTDKTFSLANILNR